MQEPTVAPRLPAVEAESAGANAPVEAPARLRGLDGVRGVALLGILLANVRQMFLPWDPAEFDVSLGGSERLAWLDWQLFHGLVDFKFLTLFSLLFGVGFALQSERLRPEAGFVAFYLRRVGILAAFGVAHALLLYPAEVLMPYAVAGLLLLAGHRWSGVTLFRVGLVLLGTATIWQYQIVSDLPLVPGVLAGVPALLAATVVLLRRRPPWAALVPCAAVVLAAGWLLTPRVVPGGSASAVAGEYREARQQLAAMRGSDASAWPEELRVRREARFGALVRLHARQYADILLGFAVVLLWRTLGLFMIGAGLFRLGAFTRAGPPAWRRVSVLGLGVGLPATALATWLYGRELRGLADWRLPELLHELSALPLAAGIAGAVFLLHDRGPRRWLWDRVEAAGRMPLTNYVGQSLTMAALAEPWGLEAYGRLGGPPLTGLAVVVFALLAVLSHAWLRRFRLGPLEWLWRCGTYWRALPNRIGSPNRA